MRMTKGKVIGILCATIGALIGGIFDDFARRSEIEEAVADYMAAKEKEEQEASTKEV